MVASRGKGDPPGEQLLSLQGAMEKLLPPKQGKARSILGLSRIFRKLLLTPYQFSVAAGTTQGFLAKRLQAGYRTAVIFLNASVY